MNLNNEKYRSDIFDEAMTALGLRIDMETEPEMIREILEEMKLDDFETTFLPMKIFLKEIVSTPQSLQPMFEDIKEGIVTKHPALVEFAELALEKNWLKKSKYIHRAVHVTFILEAMTSAMCNSSLFCAEAHSHIRQKERPLGFDSRYIISSLFRCFPLADNFFEIAKTISLDTLMTCFKYEYKDIWNGKELAKKLYKDKEINFLEYKILSQSQGLLGLIEAVRINIYEAGVAEYNKGFRANAISAHELAEDLRINLPQPEIKSGNIFPENSKNVFYDRLINESNKITSFPLSAQWTSLYETWNAAFILGELNNLDLIFPKLFIPSVINAKSENYLQARIFSLWLSIGNVFFRKCINSSSVLGPENKKEMAQAWGKINMKYAFALAKRETHEDSKTLRDSFGRMFYSPIYHLLKLIKNFLS